MNYLLDTNTCIFYLNGRAENVKQQLASLNPQNIYLCSVVKAELFYGALKSERPKQNLTKLTRFFEGLASLPFDDHAAERYGQIRTDLAKQGQLIGPNDLLIAAIALAHQVTLVSNNRREFSRVADLQLVDWLDS